MNYVKYFDILGVNTAQIPCVELQGVPNTATEGVVGLLGINVLSDEHELYKCVEVKGGIYTWMPIKNGKDGVSIIKTELNDSCELVITFSDGTQTNLGVIKGEKGEKGEQADLTKIKEKNEGKYIGFWSGNTEAYEDLEIKEDDTWYLLEDDTTLDEIDEALTNAENKISEFDAKVKGFESRTKAVEDAIPLVEDEIFNLKNDITNIENGTTEVAKAKDTRTVNGVSITKGLKYKADNGYIIPVKKILSNAITDITHSTVPTEPELYTIVYSGNVVDKELQIKFRHFVKPSDTLDYYWEYTFRAKFTNSEVGLVVYQDSNFQIRIVYLDDGTNPQGLYAMAVGSSFSTYVTEISEIIE